ncbi:MAG: CPBP family intramembrane glutamic endopeptidase [Planctomycetota bacterium]
MPDAPVLTVRVLYLACGCASLLALFWLFQRHIGGYRLLRPEPRRPVPWGPEAGLLVVGWMMLMFIPKLLGNGTGSEDFSDEQFIRTGWASAAVMIALALGGLAALGPVYGATRRDLGLPGNTAETARDLWIGLVGCLAALLPVYGVLITLKLAFQPEEAHPLLERLATQSSPGLFLMAYVTAVIAAPLFEEFTFRLILQGWLEKHFAGRGVSPVEGEPAEDAAAPATYIPQSWAPIVVSSTLFGLAHYGHGADPVPLILFGVVLGYLYERTHRILPCIFAHLVFNGISLAALWSRIA